MKIVIAGSRSIKKLSVIYEAVGKSQFYQKITEEISGEAKGIDTIGKIWAQVHKIPVKKFPVTKEDWQQNGKSAGMIRNKKMADYCDGAIIIWDGDSRGTLNMVQNMIKLKKPFDLFVYRNNILEKRNEYGHRID